MQFFRSLRSGSGGRLQEFLEVPFYVFCLLSVAFCLVSCYRDFEAVDGGELLLSPEVNTLCTKLKDDSQPLFPLPCLEGARGIQFTKFIWVVPDAYPRFFADALVDNHGEHLVRFRIRPHHGLSSNAIFTSWLTGQAPTNHFGSTIDSDNLIASMVRSRKINPIRFFGPIPSFLGLTGYIYHNTTHQLIVATTHKHYFS